MPRYAPNKMSTEVKKRYFELLREGYKGAAAARVVGISASCGSNWFIEAGSMIVSGSGPISPRFLTQNDRIAIANGLHAKQAVKEIAASIGKSFQTVYREIKRNATPDGSYHPWCAHNQFLLQRHRPKEEKIRAREPLRTLVREKLTERSNGNLSHATRMHVLLLSEGCAARGARSTTSVPCRTSFPAAPGTPVRKMTSFGGDSGYPTETPQ
ncbi:helix-turn-helix domain-containing protein [Streptomyces sp. NPDC085944]|uniref:helix-turn-helix domain-containing protein n=1 Tax=Streptomyces sp. NPDC085944 TaxID=3154962 RepID=UPI00341AA7BE